MKRGNPVSNHSFYLKNLVTEEQNAGNGSNRDWNLNNKVKNKNQWRIQWNKDLALWKINKTDKSLTRPTGKKEREGNE